VCQLPQRRTLENYWNRPKVYTLLDSYLFLW